MNKKEFEWEKELIELKRKTDLEVEEVKHKNQLNLIRLEKESRLELQRIKSAEIKRTIQRKDDRRFMENYNRS